LALIVLIVIIAGIAAYLLRPGKKPTTAQTVAVLLASIPTTILAIAAVIFQLLHNAGGEVSVSDISNNLTVITLSLVVAEILVSVIALGIRKTRVARGTGFGTCLSIAAFILEFGLLEWLGGV
jgi:hypothetical protein